MTYSSRSVTFSGHFHLNAPVERVFPLFSPLGEKYWVPGWDPEIVYPIDREWEEGMVFRTTEESGIAVWFISRLELSIHRVEYIRVEPNHLVARIEVKCTGKSADSTEVLTQYSFIGLSPAGNDAIGIMPAKEYDSKMARWAAWLEGHLSSDAARTL